MGVFWAEPERIESSSTRASRRTSRGRVWHESQQVTELADGGIRMTLNVSNDWALRSWVLGFGAARVVSPKPLADALRDELASAANCTERVWFRGSGDPRSGAER